MQPLKKGIVWTHLSSLNKLFSGFANKPTEHIQDISPITVEPTRKDLAYWQARHKIPLFQLQRLTTFTRILNLEIACVYFNQFACCSHQFTLAFSVRRISTIAIAWLCVELSIVHCLLVLAKSQIDLKLLQWSWACACKIHLLWKL